MRAWALAEGNSPEEGLAAYDAAVKTEVWPGYPAELQTLTLPDWAWRVDDDD